MHGLAHLLLGLLKGGPLLERLSGLRGRLVAGLRGDLLRGLDLLPALLLGGDLSRGSLLLGHLLGFLLNLLRGLDLLGLAERWLELAWGLCDALRCQGGLLAALFLEAGMRLRVLLGLEEGVDLAFAFESRVPIGHASHS